MISSAVFFQMNALGLSFQCSAQSPIASVSASTLVNTPRFETPCGEQAEPALDEIQPPPPPPPRRRRRREVKVPPYPLGVGEPVGHRRRLVRRQVVQHNMHLKMLGHVHVDGLEERQHFFGAVTGLGVVDDLTGSDVHCYEQVSDAVALAGISHRLSPSRRHRQARLGAIQRFALRLLVEAEHHRPVSRTVLEPGGSVRVASGDQGWDPGGRPVWNNGGDTALLLDERGHVVARHRYP